MFSKFFYLVLFLVALATLTTITGVKAIKHYVTKANNVVVIMNDEAIFLGKANCVSIETYPVPSVLKKVTLHDGFLCFHESDSYINNTIEIVPIGKLEE